MSVVWHMFYVSFRTQISMVTFISKFGLRKGQCQIKLGQIRSNFQAHNFLTKHAYFAQLLSGFNKCHLLLCTTIKNSKYAFRKIDVITFTFFGYCSQK